MNNIVLITGGSGGIGFELAKIYARKKMNLLLVSRNEDKLEEKAIFLRENYGVEVDYIPLDLSIKENLYKLTKYTNEKGYFVKYLINNAGYGTRGSFADLGKEDMNMIDLNINALVYLSSYYANDMIKYKDGYILNVASQAGFIPGPLMASYYASKAFVISYTKAISKELEGKGVKISCLCPGYTQTDFATRANIHGTNLVKKGVSGVEVAEYAYTSLEKGKLIAVYPKSSSFLLQKLIHILPLSIVLNVVKKINSKS